MNTKQLQLVNFEQAQRLKKAGFNYPCDDVYFSDGEYCAEYGSADWNSGLIDGDEDTISAPTVALALKWIRDVKGFDYKIQFNSSSASYCRNRIYDDTRFRQWSFATYEAAESSLLDELLTLIEKEK